MLLRVFVPSCLLFCATASYAGGNWPQFRGSAQGHSDSIDLATTWSETENVKWKTAVPGEGWSSPVVFGNQIWMTTALENGKSRRAICVDRETGAIVHDVEVFHVDNPDAKNPFNSYASPTPAIEKGRVYISFGTNGSACLDAATAKPIWVNRELKIDHIQGPGSSPILYKDLYILCCDGADVQYVIALDKNTGTPVWKTPRSFDFGNLDGDFRKAYSTPIVVHNQGQDQLITIGSHRIYAYEPLTGRELWYCDHPNFSNASMPLFAEGMVYFSTGFGRADLWALRADGIGDVSKTHIVWRFKKGTPCRSTPVLVGEGANKTIYMVSDDGIARCVNAQNGEMVWQGRIGTGFSASPLYADGHLYFFDENGAGTVIEPGPKMQVTSRNTLDDGCMATPAVAGKALFIRTKTSLYRVEK